MATTIKLKNGSGAPTAGDLVQGEPALDLTNKRLYTEDAGGNVIEIGTSPSTIDINAGTIDGVTLGTNSAVTEAQIDNININGNTIISTDTNGNIAITPNGTGEVDISKVDINGGTIDGTVIGGASAGAGTFTTLTTGSTVTLNGGTANGVLYLNGSKVATSGSALTFDGTNLGLGGAPVAVGSSPVFEIYSGTNNGIIKFTNSTTGTTNSDGTWLYQPAGTNNFIVQNQESAGELRLYSTTHIWSNYNNSTEYMRLTSTGLGIGTSSPSGKLHIQRSNAGNFLYMNDGVACGMDVLSSSSDLIFKHQSSIGQFVFQNSSGTDRLRIDNSGNLGLGVTPSAWDSGIKALQVNARAALAAGSSSTVLGNNWYDDGNNKYIASATASYYVQNNGAHSWSTAPSGTAGNAITFTQAMTLDASGRLGIGTTSPGARIEATASGAAVQILNRTTSDGNILEFEKGGTTVGSIGTSSSQLWIGNDGTHLLFHDDDNHISPWTGTAYADGTLDLGKSNGRFKDLYLSGGVYLGGTGAANHLDDYEEGTFTPVLSGSATSGTITFAEQTGVYTKIGNIVNFKLVIDLTLVAAAPTGTVVINGMPFTNDNAGTSTERFILSLDNVNFDGTSHSINAYFNGASTQLRVIYHYDNAAFTAATYSNFTVTGGTKIVVNGCYQAA